METAQDGEISCRCGRKRTDPVVMAQARHTALGWILIAFGGISTCPKQVDLICPVCHFIFETITDPARCEKHRYR